MRAGVSGGRGHRTASGRGKPHGRGQSKLSKTLDMVCWLPKCVFWGFVAVRHGCVKHALKFGNMGLLPVHPFIYQTTELFVPQTSKVVTISSIVKCQDHLPSFSGIPFHGIPVYNVDEHHSDSPFKGEYRNDLTLPNDHFTLLHHSGSSGAPSGSSVTGFLPYCSGGFADTATSS